MAERRMFTRKLTDSDVFLDLPLSAQMLYVHFNMHADDDGFVNNPKRIIRAVKARETDLKNLIRNGFVIAFDSGVIAITHWKAHNTIKPDRYTKTQYRDEFAQLVLQTNKTYTLRKTDPKCMNAETEETDSHEPYLAGSQMDPQERINQIKVNQYREAEEKNNAVYGDIVDLYNCICTSFTKVQSLTNERINAINICLENFSKDDCLIVFEKAEASPFLKNHNGGWTVDFDWLMKTENFVKTLEGKYDDKKSCAQDRKIGALELQAIHNMNLQ